MLEDYKLKQPIVCNIIKNAIQDGKIAHAYLLEVNMCDYYEMFTLVLAKDLLASGTTDVEYTNNLQKKLDDENLMELKVIRPDGQWIKKEQIDDLHSFCSKKAIIGNKKVYIIYEAEKLNLSAANSLLKFLEEPEDNIYGILVTKNLNAMIQTIVSRCQLLSLIRQLDKRSLLTELSLIAGCNFDETKLDMYVEKIINFVDALEREDLLVLCQEKKLWLDIFSTKFDYEIGLTLMILFYRDILNVKLNKPISYYDQYSSEVKKLAKTNEIVKLTNTISVLDSYRSKIKYNINSNLLLDNLILDLKGVAV